MNLRLASGNVKILSSADVVACNSGKCLKNESYFFQLYIVGAKDGEYPVAVKSDLPVRVYEVLDRDGSSWLNRGEDGYYLHTENDKYPELLLERKSIVFDGEEHKTLFFDIAESEKTAGDHEIEISVGEEKVTFVLHVLDCELKKTDMIITHWFHSDGICNYYDVKPFSEGYYEHFKDYLKEYVRMGNTMLLIPLFTPPLDTEVGGERLTTQLVKVKKIGETYEFDMSEAEKFIGIAKEYGIEYFELSHLFTQWGGECCPKIMADVDGEEKRIFGWDTASDSPEYFNFLKQFFVVLNDFLLAQGIKEKTYMHLTDEPHADHIEKYTELMQFVKANNFGLKTMDALSHFSFVEKAGLDLPAVCTSSDEIGLFKDVKKLLYYCVFVDRDCLSNRYFYMPFLRTVILGMQLYKEKVEGFLHWGYNFYNTQYSLASIDPYENATAGDKFIAGDSFIVYPAEKGVNYSIRYFAIMRAFEDYRLLKTVEEKIGREKTVALLEEYGLKNLHEYSHDVIVYEALRSACYAVLES